VDPLASGGEQHPGARPGGPGSEPGRPMAPAGVRRPRKITPLLPVTKSRVPGVRSSRVQAMDMVKVELLDCLSWSNCLRWILNGVERRRTQRFKDTTRLLTPFGKKVVRQAGMVKSIKRRLTTSCQRAAGGGRCAPRGLELVSFI
jgi:hypothetical protein